MSSPSPSAMSDDDRDSYHPPNSPAAGSSAHATTSRRGRKPAPGSRAVREANRKANHSVIEKRRREKINETMTALRTLLAEGYVPSTTAVVDADAQDGKGKKAQDFKLEVLSRSVEYIHQLLDKVSSLESELQIERQQTASAKSEACCYSCGTAGQPRFDPLEAGATISKKRKRSVGDGLALASAPVASTSASRLPSISSLLNPQLPSPPLSVPMHATPHDVPPILTLPAARSHNQPRTLVSDNNGSSWTPDETHVASLLLGISSKTNSPTSPFVSPVIDRRNSVSSLDRFSLGPSATAGLLSTMTPAGILGIGGGRS